MLTMHLKVMLPFCVFADETGVARLVAPTVSGFFGILPQRLDGVAALAPGVLSYATAAGSEVFLAIDEGVMVKTGKDVWIAVRHAISSKNLGNLHDAVNVHFLALNAQHIQARQVSGRLESRFMQQFSRVHHAG